MKLITEVQKAIDQLPHPQCVYRDYTSTIETLQGIDHYFADKERRVSDTAHLIWTRIKSTEYRREGVTALESWNHILTRDTGR